METPRAFPAEKRRRRGPHLRKSIIFVRPFEIFRPVNKERRGEISFRDHGTARGASRERIARAEHFPQSREAYVLVYR